jgi:hypothetical protein
METFQQEFAEKGGLSEDSYKALEAKGIPKAMVDAYIEGQKALVASAEGAAYAAAGGESQYKTMITWAGTNLNAAEAEAYDRAVTSGNTADVQQAILGLRSRYEAAYGTTQSGLVNGDKSEAVRGYASESEMTRDMKDPKYRTDPAFRKQVEQKLEATTAF